MKRTEINSKDYALPFVIYTPENINGKLPLIIQLHGAGEVGNGGEDLVKVEIHGLANLFKRKDYDVITVMPQCPSDSFWIAEIPTVHELIMRIIANYPVDEKRIYLTGLSMGGYGTWNIACRYPNLFAAIAPICGGGMVWKAPRVLDMPIWAWHGTEDSIVYPSETINMINAIRKVRTNDSEIKMTLVDGVGHDVWHRAYKEELVDWLLSKSR